MKLYKIIPGKKEVTEVEYDGTYSGMQPHIKYEWLDHARMTRANDEVFVNGMGSLDYTEDDDGAFWWLHDNGMWQKFFGDAIFWGTKGEDNADPSLSIEEVRARIAYTQPLSGVIPKQETTVVSFDTIEDMMNYMFGGSSK